MPNVIVQYRLPVVTKAEPDVLKHLKLAIRRRAARELSVRRLVLRERDFSFMFFEEGPDDELIEDLQIIIFAHNFESRALASDELAKSIGEVVEEVLGAGPPHQKLTYSVSLFLGEMGYHAGPDW